MAAAAAAAAWALFAPAVLGQVCAIPGRDGPAPLAGVVNTYYPGVPGLVAAGSTTVPVSGIDASGGGAATPIEAGDLVIVIQMQDSTFDASNTDAYGDGMPGGGARGALAIASTGLYEYCVATGSVSGGSLPVNCAGAGGGLVHQYAKQSDPSPAF